MTVPDPAPQPTNIVATTQSVPVNTRKFTINQVLAALGVTSGETFSSLMLENNQFVLETTGTVTSAIILH